MKQKFFEYKALLIHVKLREEILNEIIEKGKKNPKGWKGAYRYDTRLHAREYTFLHPTFGIYQLKEWQKNPYEVIGIGEKVGRKVDEDLLKKRIGNFGIMRFNPTKLKETVEEEVSLESLIKEGIIKLELEGEMHHMPKPLDYELRKKHKKMDEKFFEMLKAERAFEGYA